MNDGFVLKGFKTLQFQAQNFHDLEISLEPKTSKDKE
jgi:hypothetical protein